MAFGFHPSTEVNKIPHLRQIKYVKDANTLLSFLSYLVQIMWLQLIFLDKKLKKVLFYNSKLEFMFPLVTLITKRFS